MKNNIIILQNSIIKKRDFLDIKVLYHMNQLGRSESHCFLRKALNKIIGVS